MRKKLKRGKKNFTRQLQKITEELIKEKGKRRSSNNNMKMVNPSSSSQKWVVRKPMRRQMSTGIIRVPTRSWIIGISTFYQIWIGIFDLVALVNNTV
jgi:hypothetical protein